MLKSTLVVALAGTAAAAAAAPAKLSSHHAATFAKMTEGPCAFPILFLSPVDPGPRGSHSAQSRPRRA